MRVAAVIVVVLAIACVATADFGKKKVDECVNVKNDKQCLDSFDAVSNCLWCLSKAVPSSCVNADQAARLPDGVFECKNSSRVETPKPVPAPEVAPVPALEKKPVDQCLDVKNDVQCLDSFDPVSGCLWCLSKAVPSSCVNAEQAARLPEGVFDCKNSSRIVKPTPKPAPKPEKKKVDECVNVKNDKQCLDSFDTVSNCLWCLSKAVPSSCVNADQAARLPDGVFECKNSTRTLAPEVPTFVPVSPSTKGTKDSDLPCYDIRSQKECKKSSDNVGKCQWCKSMVVPSVCVDPQQASRLPAGIYNCSS